MQNPCHPGVGDAVRTCQNAGIKVFLFCQTLYIRNLNPCLIIIKSCYKMLVSRYSYFRTCQNAGIKVFLFFPVALKFLFSYFCVYIDYYAF